MLSPLFIAALWSPAGKGLTSCLFLVTFIVFCYFPMWYPESDVVLDCSSPDVWRLSYFEVSNMARCFSESDVLRNINSIM